MSSVLPITFRVDGEPQTQGSMVVYNKRITHTKARQLDEWRRKISLEAQKHWDGEPINEPVTVTALFTLTPPKSVRKPEGKPADKKPDLDKLCRAVGDSLSPHRSRGLAKILFEDSRIVHWNAEKKYGLNPGVTITIERSENG